MKKLALFILILCCLPSLAEAATPSQPRASAQWTGTAHDSVFALARRGDELWAATNFGLLLSRASEPGWKTSVKTKGPAVLAVAFSPLGDGIAVGQDGLILEVKPNSDQWSTEKSGVKERLLSVVVNSRGDFLAVGAFGTVLYRPAGTNEWRKVSVKSSAGEEPHLYAAIFVSEDEALLVGENETLVDFDKGVVAHQVKLGQPAPSGKSATNQGEEVVTPSLFAVSYCDGMLVAVGQRGLVLSKRLPVETKAAPEQAHAARKGHKQEQSKDLLADWQSSRVEGQPDIYGLTCMPGGTLVGVSNNGVLVTGTRKTDAVEWKTTYAAGLNAPWLSTVLPASNDGILVGGPGKIWEVSLSDGK